ncbi:MAG: hypothetical protein ACYDIA_22590 [Candidatus Humimicrobiaceae bacterium]
MKVTETIIGAKTGAIQGMGINNKISLSKTDTGHPKIIFKNI